MMVHLLLCMLAHDVQRHLRAARRPFLSDDQAPAAHGGGSPARPARRRPRHGTRPASVRLPRAGRCTASERSWPSRVASPSTPGTCRPIRSSHPAPRSRCPHRSRRRWSAGWAEPENPSCRPFAPSGPGYSEGAWRLRPHPFAPLSQAATPVAGQPGGGLPPARRAARQGRCHSPPAAMGRHEPRAGAGAGSRRRQAVQRDSFSDQAPRRTSTDVRSWRLASSLMSAVSGERRGFQAMGRR